MKNKSILFCIFLLLKCSVSCGTGIQVRKVDCVNTVGGFSINCDGKTKPVATQQCSTGISCSTNEKEDEHSEVPIVFCNIVL